MGSPLRRDTTRHFGSSAVPWYHRSHSTSRLSFASSGRHALALYVLLARRAPPRAAGGRSYLVSRCVDVALPHALLRAHPPAGGGHAWSHPSLHRLWLFSSATDLDTPHSRHGPLSSRASPGRPPGRSRNPSRYDRFATRARVVRNLRAMSACDS